MDVIKAAAAALKPIEDEGIIVQQGWYDAALKQLHITLWKLRDYAAAHSDDDCDVEAATIQVNIWSTADQQDLVKRVKKLMKAAGFLYTEGNDTAEPDTGVFMNAMRFFYQEEAEEETEE
ncbi:MAG: hypothetical protein VZQ81_09280 [Succiniclasticum sp.]|jgi:hypothetical protein|nr:hypothetical protein [Succiniclasticum sp.]MEE3480191.1 hypothetical protein [Succiniclasticum sp.]